MYTPDLSVFVKGGRRALTEVATPETIEAEETEKVKAKIKKDIQERGSWYSTIRFLGTWGAFYKALPILRDSILPQLKNFALYFGNGVVTQLSFVWNTCANVIYPAIELGAAGVPHGNEIVLSAGELIWNQGAITYGYLRNASWGAYLVQGQVHAVRVLSGTVGVGMVLVAIYLAYETGRYYVLEPASDVAGEWLGTYIDTGDETFKELSRNTDTAMGFMGTQVERVVPNVGIGLMIAIIVFAVGQSGGIKGIWGK